MGFLPGTKLKEEKVKRSQRNASANASNYENGKHW
jgi:hypothetical protein